MLKVATPFDVILGRHEHPQKNLTDCAQEHYKAVIVVTSGTENLRSTFGAQIHCRVTRYSIRLARNSEKLPTNGQELWTRGSQAITWRYTGEPGPTVKIELVKKGTVDRLIAANVPIGNGGRGYYSWAIPDSLPFSQFYTIRITSETKAAATDDSDSRVWIGRGVDINYPKAGFVLYNDDYLEVDYTWSGLSGVQVDLI